MVGQTWVSKVHAEQLEATIGIINAHNQVASASSKKFQIGKETASFSKLIQNHKEMQLATWGVQQQFSYFPNY